jgi:hypothetical protein
MDETEELKNMRMDMIKKVEWHITYHEDRIKEYKMELRILKGVYPCDTSAVSS